MEKRKRGWFWISTAFRKSRAGARLWQSHHPIAETRNHYPALHQFNHPDQSNVLQRWLSRDPGLLKKGKGRTADRSLKTTLSATSWARADCQASRKLVAFNQGAARASQDTLSVSSRQVASGSLHQPQPGLPSPSMACGPQTGRLTVEAGPRRPPLRKHLSACSQGCPSHTQQSWRMPKLHPSQSRAAFLGYHGGIPTGACLAWTTIPPVADRPG